MTCGTASVISMRSDNIIIILLSSRFILYIKKNKSEQLLSVYISRDRSLVRARCCLSAAIRLLRTSFSFTRLVTGRIVADTLNSI